MVVPFRSGLAAVASILSIQIAPAAPLRGGDWIAQALGADLHGPSSGGPITADDLIRVRDIGGFSVSPDGTRIAFSVRQADPERNSYVQRWFVVASDGSTSPEIVDQDGGQPIPAYGFGLPQAYIVAEQPKWSPDGKRFAFRRLVEGRVELWSVDGMTLHAELKDDGQAIVTDFAWAHSGTLIFKTGLNRAKLSQNLAQEAKHGWLFDGRIPLFASYMRPSDPKCVVDTSNTACDVHVYAADDVERRSATDREVAELAAVTAASDTRAIGGQGQVAETEVVDPATAGAATPLRTVVSASPQRMVCQDPACKGTKIRSVGWLREGKSIWFQKSEDSRGRSDGAPGDRSAIYKWDISSRKVRSIVRTDDLIRDCVIRNATLFCIRETISHPPTIVAINTSSEKFTTIVDPNSMFSNKLIPIVKKIRVEDDQGNPAFAQLVYPTYYKVGTRYPLVVTQYRSHGFLRGQVGNEYPIFPLSAEGFFVLSFDRPERLNVSKTGTWADVDRAYMESGRGLVWSAIDKALNKLIAAGIVDQQKIAITGLSAGAESVHYALLHHGDRFAAAIASSGVQDLTFLAMVPAGPTRDGLMKIYDATTLVAQPGTNIWKESWVTNPSRLTTPLLVNVGEYEAMIGFEGFETLKYAGRPIEVRVFPDEQHVKYHPQSIAGIYDNNLMWLKFWLKGEEDPRPEFVEQYKRWQAMRKRLQNESDEKWPGGRP